MEPNTGHHNSVFSMEHQHTSPSRGGGGGGAIEVSNEITLRPMSPLSVQQHQQYQQQNFEMNKTAPLGAAPAAAAAVATANTLTRSTNNTSTSCDCIAERLGMDAHRLSKFYSVFLALLATVALTFSIFLVKLSHSLNASQMATVKFGTQLMLCLPFAYFYRQSLFGPAGARRWLFARGLAGSLSILAAYFSIKLINFGDSMAIRYSSPIITTIFARFFLKQHLRMVIF